MRVACLGGGPAGLYFAFSLKLRSLDADVTVYERNKPDDTSGWGVVLSVRISANDWSDDDGITPAHAIDITRAFTQAGADIIDVSAGQTSTRRSLCTGECCRHPIPIASAMRSALPPWRLASAAGLNGYPYVSHYCAAQHGVVGLTCALAQELGQMRITVNAICPGFIDTPLLQQSNSVIVEKTGLSTEKAAESLLAANPQKRFVLASEVADTALWLCSSAAAAVNGHALSLSGGEV
jgi:NAD(P)-dependent dehydrogenase (short-subunit alcohol dehydrogenase family)